MLLGVARWLPAYLSAPIDQLTKNMQPFVNLTTLSRLMKIFLQVLKSLDCVLKIAETSFVILLQVLKIGFKFLRA